MPRIFAGSLKGTILGTRQPFANHRTDFFSRSYDSPPVRTRR